jgi:hypothetical protein
MSERMPATLRRHSAPAVDCAHVGTTPRVILHKLLAPHASER